jgi:hypothetical protein
MAAWPSMSGPARATRMTPSTCPAEPPDWFEPLLGGLAGSSGTGSGLDDLGASAAAEGAGEGDGPGVGPSVGVAVAAGEGSGEGQGDAVPEGGGVGRNGAAAAACCRCCLDDVPRSMGTAGVRSGVNGALSGVSAPPRGGGTGSGDASGVNGALSGVFGAAAAEGAALAALATLAALVALAALAAIAAFAAIAALTAPAATPPAITTLLCEPPAGRAGGAVGEGNGDSSGVGMGTAAGNADATLRCEPLADETLPALVCAGAGTAAGAGTGAGAGAGAGANEPDGDTAEESSGYSAGIEGSAVCEPLRINTGSCTGETIGSAAEPDR